MLLTFILSSMLGLFIAWMLYSKFFGKKNRLPPGPNGDFIFGHTLRQWLNTDFFHEHGKAYGDIFSIRVLWFSVVIMNTYEVTKEAFNQDWLSGRFNLSFMKEFTGGGYGLLFSEGVIWRLHRRFTISVLRDFGFGKSKIELTIQNELRYLREALHSQSNQPFYPKHAFAKTVSNVINSIVFNERCSEDPDFESMIEVVSKPVRPQVALFGVFWPIVKYIPGDLTGLKESKADREIVSRFLGKKYKQHLETFDPENIRDYIDAYLLESRNNEPELFPENQLKQALFDLFGAGMETMTTTLSWVVIYLAKYPEVQRRIFEEINDAIGVSKLPETSDRTVLRYTDAVVHEILRYCAVVPFTMPRRATEAGRIRDYDIPKNSMVFTDLVSANRNGKWWKDPNNFNPENFLDEKGNLVNSNYLLAFGSGKRSCLGEALARQELFIFTCGLVQQFEFVPGSAEPLPVPEECEKTTIFRTPNKFEIVARIRDAQ